MAEPIIPAKRIEYNVITGERKEIIIPEAEYEEMKKAAAEREAEAEAKLTYIEKRRRAYPPIVDQLDIMYHTGFEGWRAVIKAIKDKYPPTTPPPPPPLNQSIPPTGGKFISL